MTTRAVELTKLYVAERGRLQRLLKRLVGSSAVAEDLAQDTFLKLSGRAIGPEDRGLLFRTGRILALDHLRAARVRNAYANEVAAASPATELPPDRVVAARRDLETFLAALRALPRRTQQVFLLSRLDNMPYPAIAKVLGVSLSTVEKEMVKALCFCREWQKDQSQA